MDLNANLEVFSPVEFINLISIYKRTGALYFEISGENGEVYFNDGIPVHAEYKGLKGEEALYNISVERHGTVSYKDGASINEHTINLTEAGTLISQIEKRKIEFDEIMSRLPAFETVLEKRADGGQEGVALRKSDWTIIRLTDGKRNIKSMIKESQLPVLEACKTIEWLLSQGLLFDKSLTEKMKKNTLQMLSDVVDNYSIKGTNSKEWADYIIETIIHSGYETIGGLLKYENEKFKFDDAVEKILDEKRVQGVKAVVLEKSFEKASNDLGVMIAKKKQKELMQKEGVSDGII